MLTEKAFVFPCNGVELLGILHHGGANARRGVLIAVGGSQWRPEYRVGSHRQFLLLARDLARVGIPTLRFDYRGMGDSGGEAQDFEGVSDDIAAALNAFFTHCSGLQEVVIWGLCDGASAALLYAWRDQRIAGLVLSNPWVRTEASIAAAYLKHYYLARLVNPELWRKIRRGEFDFVVSAGSLRDMVGSILRKSRAQSEEKPGSLVGDTNSKSLPERLADSVQRFTGPVLFILSGDDLTAAEFKEMAKSSRLWQRLLAQDRVSRRELAQADHTFSRREWHDQVSHWTIQWIKSW
jgi:uncharacterized protein